MSYIKKFIHSLSAQEIRVLGRWNLESCMIKINNKVDLANEDHCGLCSEYRNTKHTSKKVNTESSLNTEVYDEEFLRYMM